MMLLLLGKVLSFLRMFLGPNQNKIGYFLLFRSEIFLVFFNFSAFGLVRKKDQRWDAVARFRLD
jgi:hypothetical protein